VPPAPSAFRSRLVGLFALRRIDVHTIMVGRRWGVKSKLFIQVIYLGYYLAETKNLPALPDLSGRNLQRQMVFPSAGISWRVVSA